VGLALGAATAAATWITSNTVMLAPQFALQLGVWGMLAYCTASLGLLLFAPLSSRIRALMPRGYTSAEFFRLRYGRLAHAVFMLISLFYGLTWLVSMAIAGGVLLESLAGIPYFFGMSAILLTCVLYTLFGGMFAVIGTDFVQTVIILLGVVIVGVLVLGEAPAGDIHSTLLERRPMLLDLAFPAALMALFNNLLFGVGEIFHSNVWWSRAFAFRRGVAWKAYALGALLWLPIPVAAGFLGLAAPALGINVGRPDTVGPTVAAEVLGTTGALVIFVVVFCSLASSIDSLLAATGDLLTHEVVKPFVDDDDRTLRRSASIVIGTLGALTWIACLPWERRPGEAWYAGDPIGSLAEILFFAGPLVGSAIAPIAAGLYSRRGSELGAVLALVLGTGAGLLAYFQLGWYTAALIGSAVSVVVTAGNLAFARGLFDWRALDAREEVEA
jgi:Na+/proline symporter